MATLSVTLPSFGPIFRDNNFHQIADLAKMAEQAGVDRIMLTDHVVMGEHTDRYPYGPFPFPPETAWLEPLASLATAHRNLDGFGIQGDIDAVTDENGRPSIRAIHRGRPPMGGCRSHHHQRGHVIVLPVTPNGMLVSRPGNPQS